jgi:hypothetical protein
VLPDSILQEVNVEVFDNNRPLKINRSVSGDKAGEEEEEEEEDDADDDDEVALLS